MSGTAAWCKVGLPHRNRSSRRQVDAASIVRRQGDPIAYVPVEVRLGEQARHVAAAPGSSPRARSANLRQIGAAPSLRPSPTRSAGAGWQRAKVAPSGGTCAMPAGPFPAGRLPPEVPARSRAADVQTSAPPGAPGRRRRRIGRLCAMRSSLQSRRQRARRARSWFASAHAKFEVPFRHARPSSSLSQMPSSAPRSKASPALAAWEGWMGESYRV